LGERQSNRSRVVLVVLLNLVSAGCLVWTLRDARLSELKDDFAAMNWWWVGFATLMELSVYLWQALRWSLILLPVASLRFSHAVRAIYAGLFASEVVPFRVGEVLRCYLVSRWTTLPFSVSLASVLIERVFDGIWLWLGLVVTLKYVRLPRQVAFLNDGLGVFVLGCAALLALALFQPKELRAIPPQRGWRHKLAVLMNDLAQIGHSWYLLVALVQSVPYLLVQAIPIWALFQGYRFSLSVGAAFALMVVLRLVSIFPQAPANLGLFQFATRELLQRGFGVLPAEAARFSLVLWGVVKLPLLIAGFAALAVTGAKIGELKKAAEETVNR
jgi:glycosyltransferase 2 family protein